MSDSFDALPYGEASLVMTLPNGQAEILDLARFVTTKLLRSVVRSNQVVVPQIKVTTPTTAAQFSFKTASEVLVEHRVAKLKKTANVNAFAVEQLKGLLSRKSIEFNVKNLSLDHVQALVLKYMDSFGGDACSIIPTRMNRYLNLLAVVDDRRAFQLYHDEPGTRAALLDADPTKWVVGKYDNDLPFLESFYSNRLYKNF